MAKKNVHVVPSEIGWAVNPEGAAKPLSTHRTQGAASDEVIPKSWTKTGSSKQ